MQAQGRPLVLRRLPVEIDQSELKGVGKPHLLELKRGGGSSEGVSRVEAPAEACVCRSLAGHELMFAYACAEVLRYDR